MIVRIHPDSSIPVVIEFSEDLCHFAVHIPHGEDGSVIDRTLRVSGIGHLEGDAAIISVRAIIDLLPGVDDHWLVAFRTMVDSVRAMGWADEKSEHIRGHVVID